MPPRKPLRAPWLEGAKLRISALVSNPRQRRTIRTWTAPDGSAGTLVGPWVEVEG